MTLEDPLFLWEVRFSIEFTCMFPLNRMKLLFNLSLIQSVLIGAESGDSCGTSVQVDTPQERSDEEDWSMPRGKRPLAAELNSIIQQHPINRYYSAIL